MGKLMKRYNDKRPVPHALRPRELYTKKIGELCTKYLEDIGDDSIDVHVNTVESTLCVDKYGKSCYGRVMIVCIDSWKDDGDDDENDD